MADRDELINIVGAAKGFTLPMRVGTQQAISRIYGDIITAILEAGWAPGGLRMQYDASQAALSDVMTEYGEYVERTTALADEWETHGYGVQSGRVYAEQLRATREE